MSKPTRFIGLDIHKFYMVAAGVDADQNEVLSPQRVTWDRFEAWMKRNLTSRDAVVIEMTTNTWDVYDALIEHVHSVCVVHPPHVKAVINPQVMTDKIAARTLAKLLAAKLLISIWVPPREVRDLRALGGLPAADIPGAGDDAALTRADHLICNTHCAYTGHYRHGNSHANPHPHEHRLTYDHTFDNAHPYGDSHGHGDWNADPCRRHRRVQHQPGHHAPNGRGDQCIRDHPQQRQPGGRQPVREPLRQRRR
jgi:hypothetical protein